MRKFYLIILVSGVSLLFGAGTSFSASDAAVSAVPEASKIGVGDSVAVIIEVRSAKEINAVDIELSYPQDILRPLGVQTSDSAIDLWKTTPGASAGSLILEGGSSLPRAGSNMRIARVVFEALNPGRANISFKRSDLYLADGAGTLLPAEASGTEVVVGKEGSSGSARQRFLGSPTISDITLADNPFSDEKLLIFSVKDGGGGIAKTEIRAKTWFSWGPWLRAESPASIPSDIWAAEVRATSWNGEDSVKYIYAPRVAVAAILKLGIPLLLMFALYLLFKKRK